MMSQTTRTLVFAAVAVTSVAAAVATHFVTRPAPVAGFEQVGEPFYEDFEDPTEAKSLRVVAYNPDTATIREFNVEFRDGLWRIPSHHYYPADAEDRLADTAASVIGITRGALVTRREADHERYNVIDPLDEDVTELKGRGKRLTLTRGDGTVLADLIVGDKAEGTDDDRYYVRRPNENAVYLTELNIDLSTRFADWIESDLLKFERSNLRDVVINKYSVDESKYPVVDIVDREVNHLTRETSTDPWTLEGLDEETEEMRTDEVRKLVSNLDDLRIVGVRPKPQGLKPDLTFDESISSNPLVHRAMMMDLANKGFLLAQTPEGEMQLISNEGEVNAATSEGVVYELRFGEIFTGDETEIEIGSGSAASAEEQADDEPAADGSADTDAAATGNGDSAATGEETGDPADDARKRNRYLFVSVRFDPQYVGAEPVRPEKPTPPAEANSENEATDEAAGDGEDTEASESSEDTADENQADAEADATAESDEQSPDNADTADGQQPAETDPQAEYEQALAQYEQELRAFESAKAEYEQRLEEGREQVDALNERFKEWYYVISAESFENLRASRADLVKPKEQEEDGAATEESATEGPLLDNSATPPTTTPTPAEEASGEAGDEANPTEPSTDEPSADDEAEPAQPEGESSDSGESAGEPQNESLSGEDSASEDSAADTPQP